MSRSLSFNFMYMLTATIEKSSPSVTFLLLQESTLRIRCMNPKISKDIYRNGGATTLTVCH